MDPPFIRLCQHRLPRLTQVYFPEALLGHPVRHLLLRSARDHIRHLVAVRPNVRRGQHFELVLRLGVVQQPDEVASQTIPSMSSLHPPLDVLVRALLVAKGGKILGEAYAQGADASTPLLGWSMAKSLTSVMLASLEYRGLLDLAAPTSLGEWASDERAQIRVTDLLTMTDGLAFSEEYNPGDDATAMLFDSPSAADYVLAKPAAHQPGTRFNYSSGTANVLARLYENSLGGPAEARADYEQNIAAVLGFQHAVFETDAAGGFVGSSYLYVSARDWARLGQVMLNEGEINGVRLFSADWAAEATKQNTSSNQPAYGYQWWLNAGNKALRWPSLPSDSFAAMGNRQQLVMVIPSEDVVIVRLGWTAGRYPDDENFRRILEAL